MVIRDMANQHTVGKDAPWRDEETLRELYVERELSSREVAKELGCGKKAILRWLDRYDIPKRKPTKDRPPTIYTDPGGRVRIKTQIDYKQYSVLHSRLLAVAKYGFDKVSNSVVHHRNRIPWDNRFDNIELMDSQRQYAIHHVENGHKGSLNVDDVLDIRDSFSAGSSTAELAEKYGVAPKTVRQIVKKESWAWLD